MAAMNAAGEVISPGPGPVRQYHEGKHAVFQRMYEDQMAYRKLIK
jgi:hypothetical protein